MATLQVSALKQKNSKNQGNCGMKEKLSGKYGNKVILTNEQNYN